MKVLLPGFRYACVAVAIVAGNLVFGQATPDVANLCPASVSAGSGDFPVTITGTGFSQNLEVRWTAGATTTPLRVIGSTPGAVQTLTVLVPAALVAQPVVASISIVNLQQPLNIVSFLPDVAGPPYYVSFGSVVTLTCHAVNVASMTISNQAGVVLAQTTDKEFAADTTLIARTVPFSNPEGPATTAFACNATAPNQTPQTRPLTVSLPPVSAPRVGIGPTPKVTSAPRAVSTIQFRVLARPVIRSATPLPLSAGAAVALSVDGANFIPPVAGCSSSSRLFWNDIELAATTITDTRITASIPPGFTQPGPARLNVLNPANVRSDPFPVDIATAPVITTDFLPNGILEKPYPRTTVLATGGSLPLRFSINPDLGLVINPDTGEISGVPTREGYQDVIVTLTDAAQRTDRRLYSVRFLPPLRLSVAGLAATISTEQQFVEVTVPRSYPTEIQGRLNLRFTKDQLVAGPADVRDPAQQLGSVFPRFINPEFSIVPGTTSVRIPFQPGTVAGTVTLDVTNVSVDAAPVDVGEVRTSAQIVPSSPSIRACIERQAAGLLRLRVEGSSSTREIRRAEFTFGVKPGAKVEPTTLAREDGAQLFSSFYSPGSGAPLGFGAFVYIQDFAIDGDVNDISSVNVRLENAVGSSPSVLASGTCP